MSVLINSKICDNTQDCSGIAVCPTKAISWDGKKKNIKIDNQKCINCRRCENACLKGAIKVAMNDIEYVKLEKAME